MSEEWKIILVGVFSGGVAAAVIVAIKEILIWILNRKAKIRDMKKADEKDDTQKILQEQQKSIDQILVILEKLESKLDISCQSSGVLLQDKIKYLILHYSELHEISFEDRKLLNEMWHIYHDGLGRNGDLDDLMNILYEIPLKGVS